MLLSPIVCLDHTLMKESKEVLFTPFIENISLFLSLGMVDEARPIRASEHHRGLQFLPPFGTLRPFDKLRVTETAW